MRRPSYYYVLLGFLFAVLAVTVYTTSYYLGPGLFGYHNVAVSVGKALLPGVIVVVFLIIKRRRT
jgi:hypothetical protein